VEQLGLAFKAIATGGLSPSATPQFMLILIHGCAGNCKNDKGFGESFIKRLGLSLPKGVCFNPNWVYFDGMTTTMVSVTVCTIEKHNFVVKGNINWIQLYKVRRAI